MVKKLPRNHIPDRGDVVWLNFYPQAGREQTGRRPAVVLSPPGYNGRTELALVCPITSRRKKYPFEVVFVGKTVRGFVLADQVRTVDWRKRKSVFIERMPPALLHTVQSMVFALIREE